jgi:hypothetical protein
MKKLSLLIAMILCVTIGGVYASWAYTTDESGVTEKEAFGVITMKTYDKVTSYGDFTISTNFAIQIVPLLEVDEDTTVPSANHVAAIKYTNKNGDDIAEEDAKITITFTPNASAEADIKANAIDAWYYLIDSTADKDATKTMKFDNGSGDVNIFTYATKTKIDWGTPSAGVFTATVLAKDVIALSENFLLDTIEKFEDFQAAVNGNSVMIKVTDENN